MVVDVIACALDRVVMGLRDPTEHRMPKPVQRLRDERAHVRGEGRQHAGEVVRRPVAGHVGLTETDGSSHAQPRVERVRPRRLDDDRAGLEPQTADVLLAQQATRERLLQRMGHHGPRA